MVGQWAAASALGPCRSATPPTRATAPRARAWTPRAVAIAPHQSRAALARCAIRGVGLRAGVQRGAIWNTAGTGVALSVSQTTSVFAEGFVILRGLELAGPEWFALPCGVFLGVSTRL
jgi:hypothetical protein